MIIDLRKQKRTITFELEQIGGLPDSIDDFIDELIKDLEIVLSQRKLPEGLKVEIILE